MKTNESKHTPGPWSISPDLEPDTSGYYVCGNGESICQMTGRAWYGDEPRAKRNLANAHLIAAAPELLEALENACPLLFATANGQRVTEVDVAQAKAAFAQARAAIAKAKGEA